ncbi:MAG TPA: phosphopentomutase [Syntrophomonadaceae bacterium]|nr:phosphopentomutase [Syntrophomonadaceae bacterium]
MNGRIPVHKKSGLKRVCIMVMDGIGVGALPDARDYGDEGSCTLGNLAEAVDGLNLPHLGSLGLGNIIPIKGVLPRECPLAAWGKMAMQAAGKDTTSGHWEMAGVILKTPFPVYPHGFPPEVIEPFEAGIGRKVLGNKPASGTEIIEELGAEHMATGRPIVYTSADSVFQVAAHEEVIPVPELYRICEIARQILTGKHSVGRVIARPFIGKPGHFQRTARRHDFSLPPPRPTLLDRLTEAGYQVAAVGKVADVFAGRGITKAIPAAGNREIIGKALQAFQELEKGVVFATLVDFDTLYGHRNDIRGLAGALEEFDEMLPDFLNQLKSGGVLVITADHGCDPTTPSTDHSREYVPLLMTGTGVNPRAIGTRPTMADLGATLAEYFGVAPGDGKAITGILQGGE